MIFQPLQRIQITKGTKKYRTGSQGYLICQGRLFSYNIWTTAIIFTRIGAKGKSRTELGIIYVPIMSYEFLTSAEQNAIDIVKIHEDLEPAEHPLDKGSAKLRYSDQSADSDIESISMPSKDVLDFSPNEFKAYVMAISLFIYKITYGRRTRSLNINYLKSTMSSDLKILFKKSMADEYIDIDQISSEDIAKYIIIADQHKTSHGSSPASKALDNLMSVPKERKALIKKLRRTMAIISSHTAIYNQNLVMMYAEMAKHIKLIADYYKRRTKLLKEIAESDPFDRYNYKTKGRKFKRIRPPCKIPLLNSHEEDIEPDGPEVAVSPGHPHPDATERYGGHSIMTGRLRSQARRSGLRSYRIDNIALWARSSESVDLADTVQEEAVDVPIRERVRMRRT